VKLIKSSFLYLAVVLFTTLFSTCRNDKHIANVCFSENIQPLLISQCASAGCHNPSDNAAGFDFTNYEGVMKAVTPNKPGQSKLFLAVRGNKPSMPRGKEPLTKQQVDMIKYWINFGAEKTSCGSLVCDTVSFLTYNNSIKSIVNLNCSGCHFSGHYTGHSLDSYSGTKTSINSGRFIPAIKHLSSAVAMPQNAGKLAGCDIAKIEKWVANGMPE